MDDYLKTIISIILRKDGVRTSQRTQCASVRKNYWWMLHRAVIAVYCENQMEHV